MHRLSHQQSVSSESSGGARLVLHRKCEPGSRTHLQLNMLQSPVDLDIGDILDPEPVALTVTGTEDKTSDRGSRKIDCIICYSSYNMSNRLPRRLYCGHSFCQSCIKRLDAVTNEQRWIPCPQCRQNTPTPRGGVTMLDLDLAAFLAVKSEKDAAQPPSKSEVDIDTKAPSKDKPVTQQPSGSCQETMSEAPFPGNACCKKCFCCCCCGSI
ncbi:RING finger protein 224 [Pleurodeles waltl]|uniref:RING finger protein 224 n=1 Tax=Pleurodeles waltl TaxID=8319 RepID=UPI0037097320